MDETVSAATEANAAAVLHAKLGDERSRDRFNTVTVDADVARRLLDERHAAVRDAETATDRANKASREVTSYRSQMGALMVDRDRSRMWAAELAEAALHAAAERGINADDVQQQIVHDRRLRWFQLREEVWHATGFDAIIGVLHGPAGREAENIPRKVLVEALDANKRHAEVDRRCGKTYDAKPLPDMSIPPVRKVELPVQGDLFDEPAAER